MIVFPNAKINIGLDILRKRPDGYHDINSLMVPVNWCDVLEIVPARGTDTTLTVSGRVVDCPPEKNLVMKAYRAMSERVGGLPPVDIYLRKIIPDGAGLGGGSSDAAFTIKALNSAFSLDYSEEEMADTAASIGADCPFFIYNKPMIASGTGTELRPFTSSLAVNEMQLAIIKPDASVSTAMAYAGVKPQMPSIAIETALVRPVSEWQTCIKNDFETSIFRIQPQIQDIKQRLIDMGAVYASMSGSGSAVYGFFDSDILAEDLNKEFAECVTRLTTVLK